MIRFARLPRRHRVLAAALAAFVALPSHAHAWGGATHHYIAQHWSQNLPPEIDGLRAYDAVVDSKVNDPDIRKSWIPDEGYRHYIDIDVYPGFHDGSMPHDRTQLENEYGAGTVQRNGIVPWAVDECVTRLAGQFRAGQWDAATTTIADLCHYVGDATQPLHCTANYDGDNAGDRGVHARYETDMMGRHLADLHTAGATVTYYPNPVETMFTLVLQSYDDVAPLLAADDQAAADNQYAYDDYYYAELWTLTRAFTMERIDAATRMTASLVYTAWVKAGRPVVPGSSGTVPVVAVTASALDVGPTPFRDALAIRYGGEGPLAIEVYDVRGTRIDWIAADATGSGALQWRPAASVGSGVYFVRMTGPGLDVAKRVTLVR